ncbi:MAG: serine O-acetyltransferase [Tepidisphaerales bacterium]
MAAGTQPEIPPAPYEAGAAATGGPPAPIQYRVEPGLGETDQNPKDIGFWALILEDLRTHDGDPLAQGFWALAVHRFGNWRMRVRPRVLRIPFSILYRFLYKVVEWTCGISLSYTVRVGRRVHIWHHSGIQLGARSIGNDVHIRQCTTFGVARTGAANWEKPIIEDRVDIGCGACILGPVTVGHDAVIGAHAVVLKDVPPYAVVVGVPGRVIGFRKDGRFIKLKQKLDLSDERCRSCGESIGRNDVV